MTVTFKSPQIRELSMAFPGDKKPFDKSMLVRTIQTMNQHLPSKRLSLTDLLRMDKPGIRGKDNAFFMMERAELDLISGSLPRFMWGRLRLPMLIEMSPDFGSGAARIQGEAEVEVVSRILGKSRPDGRQMIIYLPEVRELRRRLPTTTQYAFMTNLRENEIE
ncbi:MAG: DUF61 family protein [Methanothrix sp.]|nr:DUF61 family protein [Methanothrix sp.]